MSVDDQGSAPACRAPGSRSRGSPPDLAGSASSPGARPHPASRTEMTPRAIGTSNDLAYGQAKLAKEIPRLCRGGSKSLTFPAVAPQAPIDETSSVSRQAHAQSPIDGRQWESVKHGDESARCYAAFVPRYRGRNCTLSSDANQNRGASGIREPPSGGPRIGGAPATPIAALSGSQHKAPGFAGGYLLTGSNSVFRR